MAFLVVSSRRLGAIRRMSCTIIVRSVIHYYALNIGLLIKADLDIRDAVFLLGEAGQLPCKGLGLFNVPHFL